MEPCRLLTLLSDFGLSDSYVGVMKGAIAQVNPAVTVIDLTHQIPPQDIALARFTLMTAYPYFPVGTVHVAVVDPGVGGTRRAIAVAVGEVAAQPAGFLVGPDNGIFSGVFAAHSIITAVSLTNPRYWRTPAPSATFHGRDIFASIGAHLANGVLLTEMGDRLEPETLVRLNVPVYRRLEHCQLAAKSTEKPAAVSAEGGDVVGPSYELTGCVQAIDHFGNVITNIPEAQVSGKQWSLSISTVTLTGKQTYSDRPTGELVALVGSHGWVEVAVNGGSAQARLHLNREQSTNLAEIVVSCWLLETE
ncbi:MAG: S-adenosyl-l-methionine hydroxide adenosyltransferase family protein [Stenomitos frigidus ULC029]